MAEIAIGERKKNAQKGVGWGGNSWEQDAQGNRRLDVYNPRVSDSFI
jgi:hypothetical protein